MSAESSPQNDDASGASIADVFSGPAAYPTIDFTAAKRGLSAANTGLSAGNMSVYSAANASSDTLFNVDDSQSANTTAGAAPADSDVLNAARALQFRPSPNSSPEQSRLRNRGLSKLGPETAIANDKVVKIRIKATGKRHQRKPAIITPQSASVSPEQAASMLHPTADPTTLPAFHVAFPPNPKQKRGNFARVARPNFSMETQLNLRTWLNEHIDHPYPSDAAKVQMCRDNAMSIPQINDWFVNARRRYMKKKNAEGGLKIGRLESHKESNYQTANELMTAQQDMGHLSTAPQYQSGLGLNSLQAVQIGSSNNTNQNTTQSWPTMSTNGLEPESFLTQSFSVPNANNTLAMSHANPILSSFNQFTTMDSNHQALYPHQIDPSMGMPHYSSMDFSPHQFIQQSPFTFDSPQTQQQNHLGTWDQFQNMQETLVNREPTSAHEIGHVAETRDSVDGLDLTSDLVNSGGGGYSKIKH